MWITESLCCIAEFGNIVNWLISVKNTETHIHKHHYPFIIRTSVGQKSRVQCGPSFSGSLLIISQGWYEVVRWAVSFSGDGSTSKLILAHSWVQFLAVLGQRPPFPCRLLTRGWSLLPESCCIPSRAFCFCIVSSFPPLAARDHVPLIL